MTVHDFYSFKVTFVKFITTVHIITTSLKKHFNSRISDAKFWVGRGPKPSPQGIRVPDENGKMVPLRRYDRKTVVLTLPGDLTVFDIGHFGIWCEAFTVDFGHLQIPQNLNVPPSLKMLGISPQVQPFLNKNASMHKNESIIHVKTARYVEILAAILQNGRIFA